MYNVAILLMTQPVSKLPNMRKKVQNINYSNRLDIDENVGKPILRWLDSLAFLFWFDDVAGCYFETMSLRPPTDHNDLLITSIQLAILTKFITGLETRN